MCINLCKRLSHLARVAFLVRFAIAAKGVNTLTFLNDIRQQMESTQVQLHDQQVIELRKRQLAALKQIGRHRQQILQRHAGKPLDLPIDRVIDQIREERDAELFAPHP